MVTVVKYKCSLCRVCPRFLPFNRPFFLALVAKCLLMVVLLGLCKCYKEFGLDLLYLKSILR